MERSVKDALTVVRGQLEPPGNDRIGGGVRSLVLWEGSEVYAKYEIVPPGAAGVWHTHPQETFIFVINGKVRADYGLHKDSFCYAEAGDCIIMAANLPHRPVNDSKAMLTCLVIRAAKQEDVIPC